MRKPTDMLILLAAAALSSGCGLEPCAPSFGLYASGSETDLAVAACPVSEGSSSEPTCSLQTGDIIDGGSIRILHQLPTHKSFQVTTEEPLVVTLETSCGATEREFDYDGNGYIEANMVLPPGASCGLTVTATIANDTQTCVFRGSDCADLDTRCEGFETDADTTSTGG